ncbi:hypothetical protein SETIT_5G390400v2 [Setaria italica]|uniref:Uncharacterized protein n=1 Tax=Setaria italica TaxID=4555 RepID=A0A368RF88_SETIT|nr:putative histone-lysine N-methyltransferase PRDM6 [Setaria italica]RCV28250.1 hypothetical protein SETIT_5G390400v2 [Setaria italica]
MRAMPQVDLESLVCGVSGAGAGDRKVSCETVIAGGSGDASPPRMPPPPPPPDPDFPPDSITIPIGDEAAFVELNPIYERDDSTKGSTNPKFAAAVVANPVAAKTRSNSTRVAGAPAAAAGTTFFGLPAKIRPPFSRRRPSQGRILADKRSGGGGGGSTSSRGDGGEVEPRSPKVSCIGKVLSDRERHGRRRRRRRGWWHGVAAMFRCDGCCRAPRSASRKMALEDDDEHQPGIAGMRRFKSGRRAASWGEEALAAAVAAVAEESEEKAKPDSQDAEQWSLRPVN